jgi:hypothetical protein
MVMMWRRRMKRVADPVMMMSLRLGQMVSRVAGIVWMIGFRVERAWGM